jgi:hypothetical protein
MCPLQQDKFLCVKNSYLPFILFQRPLFVQTQFPPLVNKKVYRLAYQRRSRIRGEAISPFLQDVPSFRIKALAINV